MQTYLRHSQIDNLNHIVHRNQQIARLDVFVYDTLRVEILETIYKLDEISKTILI